MPLQPFPLLIAFKHLEGPAAGALSEATKVAVPQICEANHSLWGRNSRTNAVFSAVLTKRSAAVGQIARQFKNPA